MNTHANMEFIIPDNVSFVKTILSQSQRTVITLLIAISVLMVIVAFQLVTNESWSKTWLWLLIPSLTIITCTFSLSYHLWQQIQYVDVIFERNRASNRVLKNIFLDVRSKETEARELLFDNLLHGMLWVDYETFGPLFYDIHAEDVRAFREYCDKKQRVLQPKLSKQLASKPDPDHPRGAVSTKQNDDLSGILRMLDYILAN